MTVPHSPVTPLDPNTIQLAYKQCQCRIKCQTHPQNLHCHCTKKHVSPNHLVRKGLNLANALTLYSQYLIESRLLHFWLRNGPDRGEGGGQSETERREGLGGAPNAPGRDEPVEGVA